MNLKEFYSRISGNRRLLGLSLILISLILSFTAQHSAQHAEPAVPAITHVEVKQREENFQQELLKHPGALVVVNLLFLALLAAGLTLNISAVRRKLNGEPLLDGEGISRDVPWNPGDIGWAFVFLFVCEIVVTSFEEVFFSKSGLHPDINIMTMINSLVRDGMAVIFVLWIVRGYFQKGFEELGLRFSDWRQNIQKGFAAYVALLPVMLVLMVLMAVVIQAFSYEPQPQKVVQMYLDDSVSRYLAYLTLFVAVIGPVAEEIFFRGFAYQALRKHFGYRPAIFLSSAFFALMHFNLIAFVPILLFGMLLAYLYEKTGNLAASMAVHVFHNLLMIAITMVFKSLSG